MHDQGQSSGKRMATGVTAAMSRFQVWQTRKACRAVCTVQVQYFAKLRMQVLLVVMQRPLPVDAAMLLDGREKSSWWKLRKWLLRVAYRLLDRYGDPKIVRIETSRDFASLFLQEFSPSFLKVCTAHPTNFPVDMSHA